MSGNEQNNSSAQEGSNNTVANNNNTTTTNTTTNNNNNDSNTTVANNNTTTTTNTTTNHSDPTQQVVHEGTWVQENTKGPSPSARNGHRMVTYRENLYVYGGNNKQEDQSNQISMYTPETQTWYPLREGPARTLHSAVVHKDKMIVFGGTGQQEVKSLFRQSTYTSALFNDVWTFQFGTQQWDKMATTGSFPVPRDGHVAVVHNDTMYMFGGSDNSNVFGDLYSLDIERRLWMQARSEGTIPSPRRMHSCVVWDDCLWVFGGYDGKTSFNDVFMYNIASGTWSIPRTNGAVPIKRFGHSAVVYKDSMYIFGGYGAGFRSDLLHFHFPTCTWTLVSEKPALAARRGHAASVYRDSMYLFAGGITSSTYSNDMWAYTFRDEKVEEIKNPLTDDLLRMLNNAAFYPDVVFKLAEGKTIKAHKCLLSVRCSYFDSLFKSGFQEASTSEIVIEDIGEEVFVVFLQYLYGGPEHLITPEVSFELLTIAERYMLPHLKWVCESVVLGGIAVENVATLLTASDTYKCTRLYRACMDFISKNHQQVSKEDFKTLPHNLVIEVMGVISAAK